MAIKKISEFTSATPTASDMILFEQSGAGKSTKISNAVNTCSLTLEEIQATTDLTGKIASASALKDFVKHKTVSVTTNQNGSALIDMSPDYIIIISAFSLSAGYKLVPVVSNNTWYVNAYDTTGTTMSTITNKTLTVEVYYISKI